MIEIRNLVKDYGPIRALNGVSFTVEKGEVVGFLGPNGAGKTTCMKILTGFIAASSGTVTVAGMDVVNRGLEVRRRIGYLPENAPLYTDMTPREYLSFVGDVRGIGPRELPERIQRVALRVGIVPVMDQEIGTLSKGYRQRVGLAQAMIHDPDILVLDEPTSGLDPNQIVEIREVIRDLGQDRTVILSTHNLPEVTATCNRIVLIHKGQVRADGTPDAITARHGGGNTYRLEVLVPGGSPEPRTLLGSRPEVAEVTPLEVPGAAGQVFRVAARGEEDLRPALFRWCVEAGWTLLESRRERLDLEAIFQRLTLS
ncbi:ATP-binding cassette domain-containing protein [Myxococcota bacterium]|jgi:ABC-2 type transport system ATP-binding protein|nr:ATP-binding cassette domain-containing protein [Myxococcota bacterium]